MRRSISDEGMKRIARRIGQWSSYGEGLVVNDIAVLWGYTPEGAPSVLGGIFYFSDKAKFLAYGAGTELSKLILPDGTVLEEGAGKDYDRYMKAYDQYGPYAPERPATPEEYSEFNSVLGTSLEPQEGGLPQELSEPRTQEEWNKYYTDLGVV